MNFGLEGMKTELKVEDQNPQVMYKVLQIWPGQIVTCLHTDSPGHIWTTLYNVELYVMRKITETVIVKIVCHTKKLRARES